LLFLARVSDNLRRLSNLNPTADPAMINIKGYNLNSIAETSHFVNDGEVKMETTNPSQITLKYNES